MRAAHIQDLKNQVPDYLANSGFNLDIILSKYINKSAKLKLFVYHLTKEQEKILLDKVKVFGYEVNQNYKVKDLINTRKSFNYVQAHDIFNSIQLKISAPLKQVINSAFMEGVTIWHVRDLNDFKGILDYDADNTEV